MEHNLCPPLDDTRHDSAKEAALDFLDAPQTLERFGKMSDAIWGFAELGMQEFQTVSLLKRTLLDEGFSIEDNVSGMPTCFTATWGKGSPVIGLLGEYDALPLLSQKSLATRPEALLKGGPGHGCGHNLMSPAAIAAAIAVKKSLEVFPRPGTVKFFGCPAEESGISRPYMVRDGVFRDVDAVINNHTFGQFQTFHGLNPGASTAKISVVFSFAGKTAHAAIAPWVGRSALKAVEIMNVAVNYLREQLPPTHRVHYVVVDGGEVPNVTPDKASVWYYVRDADEHIEESYRRVVDCAHAAALASGTSLETIRVISAHHSIFENKCLAEAIYRNMQRVGMPKWSDSEQDFARSLQRALGMPETGYPTEISPIPPPVTVGKGGSGDAGDVSQVVPMASVNFPGWVPGAHGHHWSAVSSGYGTACWKGLNAGAKVIASTVLDLMTTPGLLQDVRDEYKTYAESHPFKSLLPPDAVPPVDLNREAMERFRSLNTAG